MHAAKPAAAIEQATAGFSSNRPRHAKGIYLTSYLSLTSTLRSRYRTTTFKQHPDRLRVRQVLRHKRPSKGQPTEAVNKKVVMDF